ncbi:putative oxidoreductase [Embleya hyalina]|uniref:Putative oxidoreductase n=1 Tax=Embleya hyalina TaxID=516124 RepID=A0A401YCR2_9ACTN|nr:putative oxidoreductase [Embleya hyalina]
MAGRAIVGPRLTLSVVGTGVYAFGRLFLANPDLPRRLAVGAGFNRPPRTGRCGGGAEGYPDHPRPDG